MTVLQLADETIALFLEYRDQHGYDEEVARCKAVMDVADAVSLDMLPAAVKMLTPPGRVAQLIGRVGPDHEIDENQFGTEAEYRDFVERL